MIQSPSANLSADSPITSRSQDVLGYAPFARSLALGLVSAPRDGFVVGVQAQWGMGKTSAVNLLLEFLTEQELGLAEEKRTIISFFNPWLFSGVDALARGYIGELGSLIANALGEQRFSRSKKLLRSVARGGSELVGGAAALAVIAATGGAAIPLAATIIARGSGRALRQRDDSGQFLFSYDNDQRMRMLLTLLFDKYTSEQPKADFLDLASDETCDLSVVAMMLAKVGQPFNLVYTDSDASAPQVLTEDELEEVVQAFILRVKAAAEGGTLAEQPQLWLLLRIWSEKTAEGEAKEWVTKQLGDPIATKAIAFSAMNIMSHSAAGVRRSMNRLPESKIYDVDAITTAVSAHIDSGSYEGIDLIDLTTFIDAVGKLKAGESVDW